MEANLPFRKILKLALITIPFFGITGATPAFVFPNFSYSRVIGGFTIVMLITSIIWAVNIFLLYRSLKWKPLQKTSVRFIVSSLIPSAISLFTFNLIRYLKPFSELSGPAFAPPFKSAMVAFPITQTLAINVIVFILIELFLLRELKNKIVVENEQLKTANLDAKINSLKEQLHPHFLFNSLSTLRSLISRSPESAETYLEELSGLLRFSTSNSKAIIPLKDEVRLCTTYLNMQKVRFGDALTFDINIPEEKMINIEVPVYSLQQLAENAIKHNIHTRELPLHVNIVYNGITNEVIISNNLQVKQILDDTVSGTGLANLNERYRLLGYNGISIKKSEKKFSVAIQLIKHESSNN